MKYIHELYRNFKKLQKRKRGKFRDLFIIELLDKNRSIIKTILIVFTVIFLIFIVFIDIPRFKNGILFDLPAYIWIFSGRVSIFTFSFLALIVSFIFKPVITKSNYRPIRILQQIIASIITLALIVNAVGDYILTGSIETYIGVFLAIGILFQMTDIYSFFFFFLSFLLFIGTLAMVTPGDGFIPITLFVNCFSFSLFSFIISRISYYSELNKFYQKMIIVEQKDKLEELSTVDQLTKVYNRRKFNDLISNEIERANRYKHRFAVVMFDIDHFKQVNDTYGHQTGDSVLVEICSLVKNNLRKTDSIIRWGGEEFVVIAAETTLPNARILGEKLKALVSSHTFPEVGLITASFGISDYINSETAETLMKRVDSALYSAKEKGRNRVEIA
ncbi:MAG: GGDEF domain-containing protein [Spirochaetaceae bacterium]|nr:GGDEF domain-containing protein [Spirochaetaceae bacterium]